MDIEKHLGFLVKDYGIKYAYQDFKNCYGGNWRVYTHCFYNESGCFTIHYLPQRGELDFYFAKEFSNVRENLCERLIDINSVEKEIWKKHEKLLFFKDPFFWWNNKKILQALAEVIKAQIKKRGEFFGVKVKK